jgi:hypothetical protein
VTRAQWLILIGVALYILAALALIDHVMSTADVVVCSDNAPC